jgi:hypothetical protein
MPQLCVVQREVGVKHIKMRFFTQGVATPRYYNAQKAAKDLKLGANPWEKTPKPISGKTGPHLVAFAHSGTENPYSLASSR